MSEEKPVDMADDSPREEKAEKLAKRLHEVGEVKVTFHPQAWQNDYAVPVDPEGETEFIVPREDATDDEGELLPDDSYESDALKDHPNAPEWIRRWSGPFYILLEEV